MKETERGKVSSCMEGEETPSELPRGVPIRTSLFPRTLIGDRGKPGSPSALNLQLN